MEFRKKPDYADTAYREAVTRLRILLAESYTPIKRTYRELDSAGEETDNQSMISGGSRNSRVTRPYYHYYPVTTPRRYHYYPPLRSTLSTLPKEPEKTTIDPPKFENTAAPPELMSFIERQEDYIEQLEKESRFCRNELSSLMSKVKDVITENENLHEKQKSKLIKSMFDHLETETETETEIEFKNLSMKSPKRSRTKIIEGPSIVYESRISELEAQLTQAKIDLKKAQEENEDCRRKIGDGTVLDGLTYDTYRKQIDKLQMEKDDLQDTVSKLQIALSKLKDKEFDTSDQVKRSLDVAEQAQYEKSAAELEIRRLKDELERQHSKLRDAIADQSRRVSDERSAVERRYTQQIEQLTTELGVQWESTNKLQLELDKQRRENADLRREVAQKQALIDDLKKEMQNRIINLQSDIGVSGAEKSALEQQIATLHIANERTERQSKQEIIRLQAEMQSLRQRLDRADSDLIHSRRENIRLTEQIASLEKELKLNAALSEEKSKSPRGGDIMALPPPAPKKEDREKELSSMIHDMENKHAATVAELETMIHSQKQLMDKLSTECHALTEKLDDANARHKEEIRELQTNLDQLNSKLTQSQNSPPSSVKANTNDSSKSNEKSRPPTLTSQKEENLNSTSSISNEPPSISSPQENLKFSQNYSPTEIYTENPKNNSPRISFDNDKEYSSQVELKNNDSFSVDSNDKQNPTQVELKNNNSFSVDSKNQQYSRQQDGVKSKDYYSPTGKSSEKPNNDTPKLSFNTVEYPEPEEKDKNTEKTSLDLFSNYTVDDSKNQQYSSNFSKSDTVENETVKNFTSDTNPDYNDSIQKVDDVDKNLSRSPTEDIKLNEPPGSKHSSLDEDSKQPSFEEDSKQLSIDEDSNPMLSGDSREQSLEDTSVTEKEPILQSMESIQENELDDPEPVRPPSRTSNPDTTRAPTPSRSGVNSSLRRTGDPKTTSSVRSTRLQKDKPPLRSTRSVKNIKSPVTKPTK